MIELGPAGRGGTPEEVGAVGALLTEPDGAFITGGDFLMDGGVTAPFFYGEVARPDRSRRLRQPTLDPRPRGREGDPRGFGGAAVRTPAEHR